MDWPEPLHYTQPCRDCGEALELDAAAYEVCLRPICAQCLADRIDSMLYVGRTLRRRYQLYPYRRPALAARVQEE